MSPKDSLVGLQVEERERNYQKLSFLQVELWFMGTEQTIEGYSSFWGYMTVITVKCYSYASQ